MARGCRGVILESNGLYSQNASPYFLQFAPFPSNALQVSVEGQPQLQSAARITAYVRPTPPRAVLPTTTKTVGRAEYVGRCPDSIRLTKMLCRSE